jgi:hypothetical protein
MAGDPLENSVCQPFDTVAVQDHQARFDVTGHALCLTKVKKKGSGGGCIQLASEVSGSGSESITEWLRLPTGRLGAVACQGSGLGELIAELRERIGACSGSNVENWRPICQSAVRRKRGIGY